MPQPWDIAGSFNSAAEGAQKIDQNMVDKAGQIAAGKALMQMFNPPVPGAQPMQGGPQQPGQPPQGFPQGGGDIMSRLKGLFSQPQQSPGGGGQPGMPPQQMPGQQPMPPQMPQRPMMQAPVPGAQPMQPQGGPPQQPQMPQQQPQQGGAPTGMLDWKSVVQQVKAANPGADPRVIMTAVNQFLPIMTQQSQMEWKTVMAQSAQQRAGAYQESVEQRPGLVAEQQAGADRRVGMQQAGAQQRVDTQQAGANQRSQAGIVSRETIAAASRDERQAMFDANLISKQQMDEANRNERGRESDQRATVQREAEGGRQSRAELSATTKTTLAKLSTQARKEIEAAKLQVEGIKEDNRNLRAGAAIEERDRIANLSANTRKEIAKLNADERKDLTTYLEAGRQERAAQSLGARAEEGDKNRQERADIAGNAEKGRTDRAIMGEQGKENRFATTTARLEHSATVRQDQGWQRLALQEQALRNRIKQSGDQRLLSQWRAVVDAQHKRAQEIISSGSTGGQPLDPTERQKLLKDEDTFYTTQIKSMKSGGQPVQVKTPEEADKLPIGTPYTNPAGQQFTR